MSIYEILGTVLGIVGVWLMIRQNVWGWPVGIVQVALYAWVFYEARLYSDALLQLFFFAIQAYGWWHWLRGEKDEGGVTRTQPAALPVTQLRWRGVLGWIGAGAIATATWGELMRRTTDAALPHWDAFILVFSLIAQWLQARKRLECWAGWMIVNVVAIGVYWAKDLRLTAGLYLVFFGMAVAGHVAWRRSLATSLGH
ncbi:nicotinamide riboside transporter PnuC [Opitutus terrae]|uniref:Nicotinamide riboside transporter PnuC n=1 Tax=Opitutus terrae (strain DSM 11246 / JCM 15787 / PB90-1) TaxID=452637 RepID=B1ZPE2_OPITP|nr:nicotinamide riboside transporter PnuC [Opitutus terrae]ACB73547.1 nicotinamide mononucleotide transporter PnuC [Opitutus terrae PB90-1]